MAAPPVDVEDEAAAEAEREAEDCWLAKLAVKPVLFVHVLPRVAFEPLTKFTGAHCSNYKPMGRGRSELGRPT